MRSREDLVRQFSAADGSNPLADFKAGTICLQAGGRAPAPDPAGTAGAHRRARAPDLGELREEERLDAVDAERERGTAKGRTFEESVAAALDACALTQGDVAEAVGDLKGAGRTGDVAWRSTRAGPARGRMVFEAKDRKLSTPKALAELDRALADRDADFAVLVVPTESGDTGLPCSRCASTTATSWWSLSTRTSQRASRSSWATGWRAPGS